MINKNKLLRIMYWYNIFVTGGFSLVIFATALFPELNRLIFWSGFDPITASLVIPFYIVIAVSCALSLKAPEKAQLILKMQIFYKPVSIVLILYFLSKNAIHPVWALIIIAGLLLFIAGNITALLWKHE